jgi:Glycosyl hydrolase family 46
MVRIAPCRALISDRFPVASFVVHVPPDRVFEIACATDPRLFHADHQRRRTANNFFTTRMGGLMRAPAGQATYLVPPDQLRRFAGSQRLYYALGSYRGMSGEDAVFTIAPDALHAIPCIQLAADFTGRTLDRARIGARAPAEARYGSANGTLTWGGDLALRAYRRDAPAATSTRRRADAAYDDGFDPGLWSRSTTPRIGRAMGLDDEDGGDGGYGGPANDADAGADAGSADGGTDGGTESGSDGGSDGGYDDGGTSADAGAPDGAKASAPDGGDAGDGYDGGDGGADGGDGDGGTADGGADDGGHGDGGAADGGAGGGSKAAKPSGAGGGAGATLVNVKGSDKLDQPFKDKVIAIAKDLGTDPNWLLAVMSFETGQTFSPAIKNKAGSGATGLIQFMPLTAKGLGTTTDALAKMTQLQQLDYVAKYFKPFKGRLKSLEDTYMAVFLPSAIGKGSSHVLFSKPSTGYTQNAGLDVNGDGKITAGEAASRVRAQLPSGYATTMGMAPVRRAAAAYGRRPEPPGYEDARALRQARALVSGARYGHRQAALGLDDDAPAFIGDDSAAEGDLDAGPPPVESVDATSGPGDAEQVGERADDFNDTAVIEELPELAPDGEAGEQLAGPTSISGNVGAPERIRIIDVVAEAESGSNRHKRFVAVNPDGEFHDPAHPFYHRVHVGLSWGLIQFTQRSGSLGKVLALCYQRDPALFARVFGASEQKLRELTGSTKRLDDARIAPLDGANLWEEPWLSRFRAAGSERAFQIAQLQAADTIYFIPQLAFAGWLGLDTDRALAVLYDRVVHAGSGGGRAFVLDSVSPIRSVTQQHAALESLGFADLRAFQGSVPGLTGDGRWTSDTHAALIGALRAQGASAALAVPGRDEMLQRMLRAARRSTSGTSAVVLRRLTNLLSTPKLNDTVYLVP